MIEPQNSSEVPEWVATSLPWLGALLLIATCAGTVGVWMLLQRLRELEKLWLRLDALEEIKAALQQLAHDRGDLDLRRIEHVLIEMRDGQRRLEDAILRAAQAAHRPTPDSAPEPADEATGLCERIVQRLLAHGYEQVHVVPTLEDLGELFHSGGAHEVLVEARRNGMLCKGRVLLRDGAVVDVELKPAYTMFP
jgi:hypothetical protein